MGRKHHPAADGRAFFERLPRRDLTVALLVPLLLLGLLTAARAGIVRPPTAAQLQGGAGNLSPAELKAAAADELARSIAQGGAGITFEIVQRSAIHSGSGDKAQVHELGTYLEAGTLTADGYFAEIRRGPDDLDATPDFEGAPLEMSALVRDGVTWRNDGDGWYETLNPPGLGLDPATALLLPTMLRETSAPKDEGTKPIDDAAARVVSATAKVPDIPGVIAVDLADSTELNGPVQFAFDDAGRLIELTVVARNTRLTDADLLVTTVMTFAYPVQATSLPDPANDLRPADEPVVEAQS